MTEPHPGSSPESTDGPEPRTPWGAVVAFLVATLAAAGFAVCYALDLGTESLGATLGVAFAALAVGLALWSGAIARQEPEYVEQRAVGPVPDKEYDAFKEALTTEPIPRVRFLWGSLGLAGTALGTAALFPLRSLLPRGTPGPNQLLERTGQKRGVRLVTAEGKAVRSDDLDVGSVLTVFPEGLDPRHNVDTTTVLVRVDPADLDLPEGRDAWVVDGVVAYSKLCTHAGCPVGLYADEYHQLTCPCHFSIFDVLRGAEPVEGPASRPLPQLPLGADPDGYLIALGDFTAPVGPGWWGYDA